MNNTNLTTLGILSSLLLVSLLSNSLQAAPSTASAPCRCKQTTSKTEVRSGEYSFIYNAEQHNGTGCYGPPVRGPKGPKEAPAPASERHGIAASYVPASFRLVRHNTSGHPLKQYEVQDELGGKVEIYRHVVVDGKKREQLVETLVSKKSKSMRVLDVAANGITGSSGFPWDKVSNAPAGDYVARLVEPATNLEIHFKLQDPRGRD